MKKKLKNIFLFSLFGCLPVGTTLLVGCSTSQNNSSVNQSNSILEEYIKQFDVIFNNSTAETFDSNIDNFQSLYLKTETSTINDDLVNLLSNKIQFLNELETNPNINELILYADKIGNLGNFYKINLNNEEDRNKIISQKDLSFNSIILNNENEITFRLNVDLNPNGFKFFPTTRTRSWQNPSPWTHKVESETIDISLKAKYDEFFFLKDVSHSYEEFMGKLSNISIEEQNSNKIFLGLIENPDGKIKLAFSTYIETNGTKTKKGSVVTNFNNGVNLDVEGVTLFSEIYFELNLS